MPEQRVVVEVELGVERQQLAVLGDDQRVDLDQRGILVDEQAVQTAEELIETLDLFAVEIELEAQSAALPRGQPGHRVDEHGVDLFRRRRGDFLDVHPAFRRGDDGEAFRFAIESDREVQLAGDLATGLDVDLAHELALGAGLLGHQRHPQDRLGVLRGLLRGLRRLDAAGLAASPGMNLGFDDGDVAAEAPGRLFGGRGIGSQLAVGHRDAVFAEKGLRLILVNVHRGGPSEREG